MYSDHAWCDTVQAVEGMRGRQLAAKFGMSDSTGDILIGERMVPLYLYLFLHAIHTHTHLSTCIAAECAYV